MRKLIAAVLLLASGAALAATATWTGNVQLVQSVTGAPAWNCEYSYAGRTFWRAFSSHCPPSVEVY